MRQLTCYGKCLISRCLCWWAGSDLFLLLTFWHSSRLRLQVCQGFLARALAMWACCSYFNQNKVIMNMQIESFTNCRSQSHSVCGSKLSRIFGETHFEWRRNFDTLMIEGQRVNGCYRQCVYHCRTSLRYNLLPFPCRPATSEPSSKTKTKVDRHKPNSNHLKSFH